MRVASEQKAHREFLYRFCDSLPLLEKLRASDETKMRSRLVKGPCFLQLLHKSEGAHNRDLGCARELRRIPVMPTWRGEQFLWEFGRKQHLEHPLVQIRKKVSGLTQAHHRD